MRHLTQSVLLCLLVVLALGSIRGCTTGGAGGGGGTPADLCAGVVCPQDSECSAATGECEPNAPGGDGEEAGAGHPCDPLGQPCAGPVDCGEQLVCLDGICSCTDGSCCADESFCNGAEICEEGVCLDGVPVDCDDGVACTADRCDEENDTCVNTPDDEACDDGLYCNGPETCDHAEDCQAGARPCNEGEICNEDTDECADCLAHADCGDGLFCLDGQCVSCRDDADCEENRFCLDTECVDCRDDADCGDVRFCLDGQCVSCRDDTDCGEGRFCLDAQCVDCRDDADCGEDRFCLDAHCVGCRDGADCADGQLCEAGECVLEPAEACATDLVCDDGEVCNTDSGDCVSAPEGGTRGLPICYEPGVPFTVRIVVNPSDETLVVGIQDFPPQGWTVSDISDDGVWDATNGAVKWVFPDGQTRTLAYAVTPPGDATGSACFAGQSNAGDGDQDAGGATCVEACSP